MSVRGHLSEDLPPIATVAGSSVKPPVRQQALGDLQDLAARAVSDAESTGVDERNPEMLKSAYASKDDILLVHIL